MVESEDSKSFYKQGGWAPIKDQYINPERYKTENNDLENRKRENVNDEKVLAKKQKKSPPLTCPNIIQPFSTSTKFDLIRKCPYGDTCKLSHDNSEFITFEPPISEKCPVLLSKHVCPSGPVCCWSKTHEEVGKTDESPKAEYLEDVDICGCNNRLDLKLKQKLRKKAYPYPASNSVLKVFGQKNSDLTSYVEREKPKLTFKGKTYLAPLTTVGNLPFRRICIDQGVDITCSEMAMVTHLLQGIPREWALLKRHSSEKLFGVQVCGNFPDTMTKCCQLMEENCEFDFVDVNCGCPIDAVFNSGCGSGLMKNHERLTKIAICMDSVLKKASVTIKMRAGIHNNKNTAHTLMMDLAKAGCVSLVSIHGRSREQRYSKLADWNYIKECRDNLQAQYSSLTETDKVVRRMEIFGNGDILSHQDYEEFLECSNVDGCMIGRGALIKPWIFKEIKERRVFDISSTERLDIIKDFVHYGLEHWGSDQRGVDSTRRFLLEWLSFTHRYIPVGLLERLPQKINEPPPPYFGRDDKETLLASNKASDWIKISEMFLGKAQDSFNFVPRHKANSYVNV